MHQGKLRCLWMKLFMILFGEILISFLPSYIVYISGFLIVVANYFIYVCFLLLYRVNYLSSYLSEVQRARAWGVDIRGYFVWSLLDNFE